MKFKLRKSSFEILKNVPDITDCLLDINNDNDYVHFVIKDENIQEVQLLINDEIVLNGMNNQDTVNDLGIKLYKIYDEIKYQKDNQ